MKVAVIGAGSTYTPELLEGLIERAGALGLDEVLLHDIDGERLAIVASFCERIARAAGASFRVRATGRLDEAVEGAGFVVTQIRVGGQRARHEDTLLCLRYGIIGQETTGMGGFAKALRTVPVILGIARAIERLAPRAWCLNFTNPVGIVTQALLDHSSVRAIGLCNIPMDAKMAIAAELGVEPRRVRLDYVGLNHLSWIRRIFVDDRDVTAGLVGAILEKGTPANIPDLDYEPALIRALEALPLYYDRFFYYPRKMFEQIRAAPMTRAEEVMEIEKKLLSLYADPSVTKKPAELSLRGGAWYSKAAIDLMEAIVRDLGEEQIVDVRNGTAIEDLPPEAVVEVPARVGRDGAAPLACGKLGPRLRGLAQTVKAYEELAVQAATRNDYGAALAAMIVHPLGPPAERAEEMLGEIIRSNDLALRSPG